MIIVDDVLFLDDEDLSTIREISRKSFNKIEKNSVRSVKLKKFLKVSEFDAFLKYTVDLKFNKVVFIGDIY